MATCPDQRVLMRAATPWWLGHRLPPRADIIGRLTPPASRRPRAPTFVVTLISTEAVAHLKTLTPTTLFSLCSFAHRCAIIAAAPLRRAAADKHLLERPKVTAASPCLDPSDHLPRLFPKRHRRVLLLPPGAPPWTDRSGRPLASSPTPRVPPHPRVPRRGWALLRPLTAVPLWSTTRRYGAPSLVIFPPLQSPQMNYLPRWRALGTTPDPLSSLELPCSGMGLVPDLASPFGWARPKLTASAAWMDNIFLYNFSSDLIQNSIEI
jgi:hypothetical protein